MKNLFNILYDVVETITRSAYQIVKDLMPIWVMIYVLDEYSRLNIIMKIILSAALLGIMIHRFKASIKKLGR